MTAKQSKLDAAIAEHPLYPIFTAAIQQAMYGKGIRHGGDTIPFEEQRWARISAGPVGANGLAFQAIKKLEEALEREDDETFEREFLGALNYMGMTYLRRMGKV